MDTVLRVGGLILLGVVILVGVSILLMHICRSKPFVRYIPTLLVWALSILLYIIGRFFAAPMQDLGYYIMSMIAGTSTFIVLIITIVISKIQDNKARKRREQ